MILTAHQPVYLPWLGLFHKIAISDSFVFFNDVQYLARDWNNRNKIKTSQGAIWLTVPVLSKGYQEKTIREIEINNSLPWRRKHWRSISINYAHSPHFSRYSPHLKSIYDREWRFLSDLNEALLKIFLEILDIRISFLKASDLGLEGKKSDLVLDMCLKLKADTYVFGMQGRDYANLHAFEEAKVRAVFQDYHHPIYSQQHGDFLSHLSIIDLLFNCGPDSRRILMEGNLQRL